MYSRAVLKSNAKLAMRSAKPSPILITLVNLAMSYLFTLVTNYDTIKYLMSPDPYLEYGLSGAYSGSPVHSLLVLALTVFINVVGFGYVKYSLDISRGESAGISTLFDGFPIFFKVIGASLLMGLFTFLWSLLLFIPGIIKSYSYRQTFYILAENPDMPILDAISMSRQMMRGHKWDLFVLDLSFILWSFLVSITLGLAALWVVPYMQVTQANFYNTLVGWRPSEATYDNAYPSEDNMN